MYQGDVSGACMTIETVETEKNYERLPSVLLQFPFLPELLLQTPYWLHVLALCLRDVFNLSAVKSAHVPGVWGYVLIKCLLCTGRGQI